MADDDDFTFCPVRPPVDGVETQKAADEILRINIDDGNGKAADEIRRINIDDGNGKAADEIRRINIDDGNGNATDKSTYQSSDSIWKVGASSQKQEMVGSLSFKIIDASSRGAHNQRPKQAAQVGASSSATVLPKEMTPPRKPTTRAKVPFEKGYSQMDWLRLTRTHPDLTGLKGQSNKRLLSLSEVKQHQSEDSMWTVLKGHVYNIAPYMKFHPGGVDMLMKAVGKDCTSLFNKYHAWVNADFLLEKCLVGILEEDRRR